VIVLRFVVVLGLLAVALAVGLYFYTRDRRYLTWAWRIAQFAFVVVIVALLLYVLERLVLI
jgi:hypothetical protein